ncbi:hypothetical protein Hanom_Chr02g00168021 [Helianthus anomalus]
MEQEFYKGFMGWVYISTEAVITYRAGKEIRKNFVYDPMWLVNCSTKDIECLFINKISNMKIKSKQCSFKKLLLFAFRKA